MKLLCEVLCIFLIVLMFTTNAVFSRPSESAGSYKELDYRLYMEDENDKNPGVVIDKVYEYPSEDPPPSHHHHHHKNDKHDKKIRKTNRLERLKRYLRNRV